MGEKARLAAVKLEGASDTTSIGARVLADIGHAIERAPPPERPDNVINLMEALRRSLGKKAARSTSKAAGKNQAQSQGCLRASFIDCCRRAPLC
jgi:hypothetical protein